MTSERYLEIVRAYLKSLLWGIKQAPDNATFSLRMMPKMHDLTQTELVQALTWLDEAIDHAQVIVRLDVLQHE